MPIVKSQYWLFTLNNPVESETQQPIPSDKVNYLVWQLEIGEEGTPHLQGYFEWKYRTTLNTLKTFNERMHFEIRGGTDVQARDYCMKEETRHRGPWEQGEFVHKSQGTRTDLKNLKIMVDEGKPELDIWNFDFPTMAKYYKAIREYKDLKIPKRDWKTEVVVYWGTPGTGKSRRAGEEAGPDAYWMNPPKEQGTFWWDGYEGQANVILDDFYGWFPWTFFLRLLDRYPMKVPVKGKMVEFCAKKIWITSNKPPDQWYNPEKFDYAPLERRLEEVTEFFIVSEE